MTKSEPLLQTDSIEALAQFWDKHDATDFDAELEEVTAPVFERRSWITIQIELPEKELKAIKRIAHEQRVDDAALIRDWVLENYMILR